MVRQYRTFEGFRTFEDFLVWLRKFVVTATDEELVKEARSWRFMMVNHQEYILRFADSWSMDKLRVELDDERYAFLSLGVCEVELKRRGLDIDTFMFPIA